MSRQEENQKVLDSCDRKHICNSFEQANLECMKLIATALFDISKSLAIIADNTATDMREADNEHI